MPPRFEGLKLNVPDILRPREEDEPRTIADLAPLPANRDVQPPPSMRITPLGQPRGPASFLQEARLLTRDMPVSPRRFEDLVMWPLYAGGMREDAAQDLAVKLMQQDARRQYQEQTVRQQQEIADYNKTAKFFEVLGRIADMPDVKLRTPYLKSVAKAFGVEVDPAIQAHFLEIAENAPDTLRELGKDIIDTPWSQLAPMLKDPVKALEFFSKFQQEGAREQVAARVAAGKRGPEEAAAGHAEAISAGLGAAEQKEIREALETPAHEPSVAEQLGNLPDDFLKDADIKIETDQAGKQRVTATKKGQGGIDFTNEADRVASALFAEQYGRPVKYGELKPNEQKQVLKTIEDAKKAIARATGAEGAYAREMVQLDLPVGLTEMRTKIFLNPKTLTRVQVSGQKLRDVLGAVDKGTIVEVDPELMRRVNDMRAVRELIPLMRDVAKRALGEGKIPGENLLIRGRAYVQQTLGLDTPFIELESLQGVRLLMSRMLQGAAQQLSNLDVQISSGLTIKMTDTMPIAERRLKLLERILDAQIEAVAKGESLPRLMQDFEPSIRQEAWALSAPSGRAPQVKGFRWSK